MITDPRRTVNLSDKSNSTGVFKPRFQWENLTNSSKIVSIERTDIKIKIVNKPLLRDKRPKAFLCREVSNFITPISVVISIVSKQQWHPWKQAELRPCECERSSVALTTISRGKPWTSSPLMMFGQGPSWSPIALLVRNSSNSCYVAMLHFQVQVCMH